MNIEYKKQTTALGMLITVTVLVVVKLVQLLFWFLGQIAKAIQAATPEIKAQIKASAPSKADDIVSRVKLRVVGDEDEQEVKAS